jgi:AbiV family abortive infection protein
MENTNRPIPPPKDLLALSDAAWENALELMTDAETLAEAGRFPRAHALATLALEECGKGILCSFAITWRTMPPEDFWDEFKDHKRKLMRATSFDWLQQDEPYRGLLEQWEMRQKASIRNHNQKLRGLYVDYRRGKRSGHILSPNQVTRKMADEWMDYAALTLLFWRINLPRGEERLDQLLAPEAQIQHRESLSVAYFEDLAEATRQAYRGEPKDRFLELLRQAGFDEADWS